MWLPLKNINIKTALELVDCDYKLIFCHKYLSEHLSCFSKVASILERQGTLVSTEFFFEKKKIIIILNSDSH